MALIYGLVRAIAVAFAKTTAWRHARVQKQFELADQAFRHSETSCKAEEVAAGRPTGFTSQFQLLKEFEKREAVHKRWKRSALKLQKRQRFAKWLSEFQGKKLPYSFGLIDMALAMKLVELTYARNVDFTLVSELIERYM